MIFALYYRSEFGYLIPSEERDELPPEDGETCANAFEHDATEHTLAVHTEWLPHLLRVSSEAMLACRAKSDCDQAAFDHLSRSSRAVTLLNGENITAWNCRRTVICEEHCSIVPERELMLNTLALSRQPKCSPTWQYRQWLLSSDIAFPSLLRVPDDYTREFDVVSRAVLRYPRNYAAWQHRHWLLQRAEHQLSKEAFSSLLMDEFVRNTDHCRLHVSDGSAFHFRRLLLYCIDRYSLRKPHDAGIEACFALSLARVYPGHESLWIHCSFSIISYISSEGENSYDKKNEYDIEDEAEEFLEALDNTLPLLEDIRNLFDQRKPSPQVLRMTVELITEDSTSSDFVKQRTLASHCLEQCSTLQD